MAHHKSAIKRIKTNEKSRLRNRIYRSKMKTEIKHFLEMTDLKEAEAQYRKTVSMLDKLVVKKILHINKAANEKSKLSKHLKSLEKPQSEKAS